MAKGLAVPPPRADEPVEETDREDRWLDTANEVAREPFARARERAARAGSREGLAGVFPEAENHLIRSLQSAQGYVGDMALAGLDAAEGALGWALGAASELVPGQSNADEERLTRDLMAMPEAFAGSPSNVAMRIPKAREAGVAFDMASDDYLPKYDPNRTNIFLTPHFPSTDKKTLGKARVMEEDGKDPKTIWRETGWMRLNDEWITEVDDSAAEIKATADQKQWPDNTVTETTVTGGQKPGDMSRWKQERTQIMADLRAGKIDGDKARDLLTDLEARMKAGSTPQVTTTTTTGERHPALDLKTEGRLNQVLLHEELEEAIGEDLFKAPTAQVGVRKMDSLGVYYPKGHTIPKGRSQINAAKGEPPKELLETFLHEVQHYVDDLQGSKMRGSAPSYASPILKYIKDHKKTFEAKMLGSPEADDALEEVRSIMGVKALSKIDANKILQTATRAGEKDDPVGAIADVLMKKDKKLDIPEATEKAKGILEKWAGTESYGNFIPAYGEFRSTQAYRIASGTDKAFQMYIRDGGEWKSNMSSARRTMSKEERRAEYPGSEESRKRMGGYQAPFDEVYNENSLKRQMYDAFHKWNKNKK